MNTIILTASPVTARRPAAGRRTVRVQGTRLPATFLGRSRDVWVGAMRPMPATLAAA